jgi:hypothetical protein
MSSPLRISSSSWLFLKSVEVHLYKPINMSNEICRHKSIEMYRHKSIDLYRCFSTDIYRYVAIDTYRHIDMD